MTRIGTIHVRDAYALRHRSGMPFVGKAAVGRAVREHDLTVIPLGVALDRAMHAFAENYGREPDMKNVVFRGSFTDQECVVEICENEPNNGKLK